jgi:hypothetical protein
MYTQPPLQDPLEGLELKPFLFMHQTRNQALSGVSRRLELSLFISMEQTG